MALFNNFPYTNFHELNLDWILARIKELEDLVSDVPTEGGLNAVRAELEVLRGQLTAAVAGLERDIDGLTAADVGALPDTVTKLPSPASLTFSGAAAGSYDGSQAVTINIPYGGAAGYTYYDKIPIQTPSGQEAGSVIVPNKTLSSGDVLLIEYNPYNSTGYGVRGLYSTVVYHSNVTSVGTIYLSAIYLADNGVAHALGRAVVIKNTPDESGIEITYGVGYQSMFGEAGAIANNSAIGINSIRVFRSNV